MLHYLMATSMGPGSGEWFGRLSQHDCILAEASEQRSLRQMAAAAAAGGGGGGAFATL